MKTKDQPAGTRREKINQPRRDPISRKRGRRLLKTVAGAAIGGVIAGPIGVAAGAMVGASVRRGPVPQKPKAKLHPKPKADRQSRADKERFVNFHPNIP
jgi:hypothetical protein